MITPLAHSKASDYIRLHHLVPWQQRRQSVWRPRLRRHRAHCLSEMTLLHPKCHGTRHRIRPWGRSRNIFHVLASKATTALPTSSTLIDSCNNMANSRNSLNWYCLARSKRIADELRRPSWNEKRSIICFYKSNKTLTRLSALLTGPGGLAAKTSHRARW